MKNLLLEPLPGVIGIGKNPDLMFKGGKVFLTGAKNSSFYGKSYETGMTIFDFLKLF